MGPGFTILAAGGVTAIAQISRGNPPSPKIIIGTGVAGAVLLVVAQKRPELAQSFASLVLLTAVLTSGYDLTKGLNAALARKPENPPTEGTPPA